MLCVFRRIFIGTKMPSGLPDDLADLPADIQNYMWAKKTISSFAISSLRMTFASKISQIPLL